MVSGATFKLYEHARGNGQYNGVTHTTEPTGIDFYTIGTQALRQQNVYHEFGHLIDNTPGTWGTFTHAVSAQGDPSWVTSDKKINPAALSSLNITNDRNYPSVQARQTYIEFGFSEQWADAFANYVAANIDLGDPGGPGPQMFNFVYNALLPYTGIP